MTRHLILILGDQLNLDNPALEGFDETLDAVLMVEASFEATQVRSHKARIVLFLSAMRHFYDALVRQYSCGLHGKYLKLGTHHYATLKEAWEAHISSLKPQKVIVCEPGEIPFRARFNNICKQTNTLLVIRDDTHFMCSRADFKYFAQGKNELRMEFFLPQNAPKI